MATAADRLANNLNFGALGKATELRQRLLFTLGALIVFRLGTFLPIPGIGKNVPNRNTIKAPKVNKSLCRNSVALPKAPKFKLFANLSAAVAIYFFVSLIFPPNFSKASTAFFEA